MFIEVDIWIYLPWCCVNCSRADNDEDLASLSNKPGLCELCTTHLIVRIKRPPSHNLRVCGVLANGYIISFLHFQRKRYAWVEVWGMPRALCVLACSLWPLAPCAPHRGLWLSVGPVCMLFIYGKAKTVPLELWFWIRCYPFWFCKNAHYKIELLFKCLLVGEAHKMDQLTGIFWGPYLMCYEMRKYLNSSSFIE